MSIVEGSRTYHPDTGSLIGYRMVRPGSGRGFFPRGGGTVSTSAAISDPRVGLLPPEIIRAHARGGPGPNPLSTVPDWGTGGRKDPNGGKGIPLMYLAGGALVLFLLMRRKKR